jgi:nucleotide-binding universal stress UspA family protein
VPGDYLQTLGTEIRHVGDLKGDVMSWLPKRKVVVPVDFSDRSIAALEQALTMVDIPSHLHVIHVLPPISPVDPGVVWDMVDDSTRIAHAKEALSERLGDIAPGVQLEVLIGDVGYEITQFAKKNDVELVVISSRGISRLRRLLIGSVADRVVRLAECPVLVLRD